MNFEKRQEWYNATSPRPCRGFVGKDIADILADWKAERVKLIGALEVACEVIDPSCHPKTREVIKSILAEVKGGGKRITPDMIVDDSCWPDGELK